MKALRTSLRLFVISFFVNIRTHAFAADATILSQFDNRQTDCSVDDNLTDWEPQSKHTELSLDLEIDSVFWV